MFNFFKTDKGIILFLIFIFFIILPFFYLHQGLLLIDTGREFYIPQQINHGGVLYKDIFNIYGALAYQFNAILFMLFGQKISVLYISGIINSILIVITLYLLSREFLSKSFSALYSVLIMFALVFPTFLYNSNITYSFAIIYSLSSFLISVLLLLNYIKSDKLYFAFLSCFFAGISLSSKYEFIFYILILLYVFFFIKPLGIKNFVKSLLCFILIPFLSYGSLFIQGLNFHDVNNAVILIKNLVTSPILEMFFGKTGVYLNFNYLAGLIFQNKIFSVFAIIPTLNILLFIILFKRIYKYKKLFIFILCSISACAKTLFYLNVNHMGIFIFPICFLAFIILISLFSKKWISLILCVCIFIFAAEDFSSLKYKNYLLETPKGKIYTYKKDGETVEYVCNYIFKNTKLTDKVVVLPEGSIINFITDRKGDNIYYNLCPLLYYDVFKEEDILNHFTYDMPEYFVILPIDNSEYGSRFFGIDYARNFYEMISNNYNLAEEKNSIKIFKRKNLL